MIIKNQFRENFEKYLYFINTYTMLQSNILIIKSYINQKIITPTMSYYNILNYIDLPSC
jgi:hypothetical protein